MIKHGNSGCYYVGKEDGNQTMHSLGYWLTQQHLSGDLGPQRGDARANRARRRHLGLRPKLLHLAAPLPARVAGPGRPGL